MIERYAIIKELMELEKGSKAQVKRSDIVYRHMKDPALLRYYYRIKNAPFTERMELAGSSPTDIFIGNYGYPKVYIGPMVPPEFGDTSLLATPERWRYMDIENIVDMRLKLVRGMYKTDVRNVEKGSMEELVRELALSGRSAESEVKFAKKPFAKLVLNDEVQPFGPSAEIKSLEVYNVKADRNIEKLNLDYDASAKTAVMELYKKNVEVSRIQRGFSAGLFGTKNKRRFVPTRWSITAVDDTISKENLKEIKHYDEVDSIYAFYNTALDNRWLIFFIPGMWQYESIEAWYPNTIWNEGNGSISIFSSYEPYEGRRTYAEIGGCYYAARLAVSEKLEEMKKQAIVLILREVHEGYLMPVGVWNVREHVRQTLQSAPIAVSDIGEMFKLIKEHLEIDPYTWVRNSSLLRELLMQKRLSEYIARS
ncbi:MAG: Nre family DNA repair protein [Candidatus Micrarchaeia archaeon]